MGKKSHTKHPHITLPNSTVISLDPLPFPIMVTIAALFFLLLAYLFVILPSSTSHERVYAVHAVTTK